MYKKLVFALMVVMLISSLSQSCLQQANPQVAVHQVLH